MRRSTTEIGQKLTGQILQLHGNETDIRAGGGTCFGDSGGPAVHGGYVVGDTSYGYTNNCRYLGGYQRIDVPARGAREPVTPSVGPAMFVPGHRVAWSPGPGGATQGRRRWR